MSRYVEKCSRYAFVSQVPGLDGKASKASFGDGGAMGALAAETREHLCTIAEGNLHPERGLGRRAEVEERADPYGHDLAA